MRVATFNIFSGRSLEDGLVVADRLREAVRRLDADVLGLQEVDRNQPRSGSLDLAAIAADAMGATNWRFVATIEGTPGEQWQAAGEQVPEGSPSYGVMLLSRWPVTDWSVVRLPALRGRVPFRSTGSRWPTFVVDEPRVAVLAAVETPSGPLVVGTTHLSFVPMWNTVQLRRLSRALPATGHLVLTGDLNLRPGPAQQASGLRSAGASATYPADRPTRQIDHVLVREMPRTIRVHSPRLPLSDHRPLVVEFDDASR